MGTCVSNQKQLALAWTMYCDDNNDLLVNFDSIRNAKGDTPWAFFPPNPVPPTPGITSPQGREIHYYRIGYKQGALFPYASNPDVPHCPADTRFKLQVGQGFAFGSVAPVGSLNGEAQQLYKRSAILRPSARYLWVEENDPRGGNLGSWIMNAAPPPAFAGAQLIDSTAAFPGDSSTFSWADGHSSSQKWRDPAMLRFAKSMAPDKFWTINPTLSQSPRDVLFMAQGYATRQTPERHA